MLLLFSIFWRNYLDPIWIEGWRTVMKHLGTETLVDETSHQCRKQDHKLLTVDSDGKQCMRRVVSAFVLVCSFASYGLMSVYDQRCLSVFFCACCKCVVWSKVVVRIFCLDINEDRMVVELNKQGRQALCVPKCFWIFTYVVGFAFGVCEALDHCWRDECLK